MYKKSGSLIWLSEPTVGTETSRINFLYYVDSNFSSRNAVSGTE